MTSENDVLDKLVKYQTLVNAFSDRNDKESEMMIVLYKLKKIKMNIDLLQKTGIGKTIKNLKSKGGKIGKTAEDLVDKWKDLVHQSINEVQTDQNDPKKNDWKEQEKKEKRKNFQKKLILKRKLSENSNHKFEESEPKKLKKSSEEIETKTTQEIQHSTSLLDLKSTQTLKSAELKLQKSNENKNKPIQAKEVDHCSSTSNNISHHKSDVSEKYYENSESSLNSLTITYKTNNKNNHKENNNDKLNKNFNKTTKQCKTSHAELNHNNKSNPNISSHNNLNNKKNNNNISKSLNETIETNNLTRGEKNENNSVNKTNYKNKNKINNEEDNLSEDEEEDEEQKGSFSSFLNYDESSYKKKNNKYNNKKLKNYDKITSKSKNSDIDANKTNFKNKKISVFKSENNKSDLIKNSSNKNNISLNKNISKKSKTIHESDDDDDEDSYYIHSDNNESEENNKEEDIINENSILGMDEMTMKLSNNAEDILSWMKRQYQMPVSQFQQREEETDKDVGLRRYSQRTLYSGRRNYHIEVPSLIQCCQQVLYDNIDAIEFVGFVPYELFHPILKKCSPEELEKFEIYNPEMMMETDPLWKDHVKKKFPGCIPGEMECWREVYFNQKEAFSAKLKKCVQSINASNAKTKQSTNKVKFIDSATVPLKKKNRFPSPSPLICLSSRPPPGAKSNKFSSKGGQRSLPPLMMKTLKMARMKFK